MKGRGARTIPTADFQAVTPDAKAKTRFVIVDAVGVTEHDFVEPTAESARSRSPQEAAGEGRRPDDHRGRNGNPGLAAGEARTCSSPPSERASWMRSLASLSATSCGALVDAVDPIGRPQRSRRRRRPRARPSAADRDAVRPLAANPELRDRILELRASPRPGHRRGQRDVLLEAHGVVDTERARVDRGVVAGLPRRAPRRNHRIQVLYAGRRATDRPSPTSGSLLTASHRPPHNWTPDIIWNAYAAIEVDPRSAHATHRTLSPISSRSIRYTLGVDDELVPYAERVQERYAGMAGATGTGRRRCSPTPSAGGWTAWS